MYEYEDYYEFFCKFFEDNCKNCADVFTEGKKMRKALCDAMYHTAQTKGD